LEAIRRRLGGGVVRQWPYLVATIAVLVAFRATLTGDGHIPYDLELYHFPLLYAVQDQLASGSLPGWDPYTYAGTPLLGNTQAAWAYPPHLILDGMLALADRPLSQRALQWLAVIHVWIAAAARCSSLATAVWATRGRRSRVCSRSCAGPRCPRPSTWA